MKQNDIIFHYDYNEYHKIFIGKVLLIEKIEEKYNQEVWKVKNMGTGNEYTTFFAKPVEWYNPEYLLPGREKGKSISIDVLAAGYDENSDLKFGISNFDYGEKKWKKIMDIERILFWKYIDNPPISLKGDKND